MGALDSKVTSGAAVLAALLFIVSAALLFMSNAGLSSDNNTIALYILAVAGILAIIFAIPMITEGTSMVRRLSGGLLALSGVLFLITPFIGASSATVFGIAGIVAGLALVADMLALWVSRVYGAMYISAVLAAVNLVMGIMILLRGYGGGYALGMLLAFAIWFVLSAYISLYVMEDPAQPKKRVVVESAVAQKKDKPQAKNKKATPKAKKVESKPAAEEKPVEPASEEPKPEPKQEQAPAKAMGDFMQKLMSSQAANRAASGASEEPKPEPKPAAEEKAAEPVAEAVPEEEPVESASVSEEPESVEDVPEIEEPEEIVEETVVEEVSEEVPEEEPMESVISQPVVVPEEIKSEVEPDWGAISGEKPVEPAPAEEKAAEPVAEAVLEEKPVEAPVVEEKVEIELVEREEPTKVTVMDDPEESIIEQPVEPAPIVEEIKSEVEPDWIGLSQDIDEAAAPVESEVQVEDIYTDNSPEALVRRAAWNKGLRCRRGYGEHNIPVAFVKGKVAVFVEPADADASIDDILREEGWTVLRYDTATITDGKAQGDEIADAIKKNTPKSTKKGTRK